MKQNSEKKVHRSSRMRYLWITLLMLLAGSGVTLAGLLDGNVAKVGTTEYATIEEAIAAWGPGKTLTLLQDVTTTSTVTVEVNATKSTQNWTLDLGDHTWTASGCNAFKLYAAGGTVMNQNYGLKIYANQNGGITASGKYCIQCTYDTSTAGYRPRLEIHGGTYNGSYIVYYNSLTWNSNSVSNGPSTWFYKSNDGTEPVFNGNFALAKCPIYIYAGYFYGSSFNTYPVSTTADTRFYGGHFKNSSALPSNNSKKNHQYNGKIYIAEDGWIHIVNAPDTWEASTTNASTILGTDKARGYSGPLYFENANKAIEQYNVSFVLNENIVATQNKTISTNATLTIDATAEGSAYTGNIVLAHNNAKLVMIFPEGGGHYGVSVNSGTLHVEETVADGIVTRTYSRISTISNPEAKVGDTAYSTVYDAFYAIDGTTDNKTIVLKKDVTNAGIVTNGTAANPAGKTVATFDLNGHSIGIGSVAAGNNADYTMTIIDSSADKTGTVTNTDASLFILALTGLNDYSGTYTLKIQAGTWMFNPETVVIKGETHNLVDEGYYARDNGNGTWTVGELPAVAKIGDVKYRTLDAAVAAANEGDLIEVLIADTYTLPGLPKNVTIQGNVEGVVFNHTTAGSIASVPNGATFKNVSFNFGNVNYHGFQHAGTIYMEGCTLNGKFFSYGDMNFTNCQFTQSNSDYHMWAYSGNLTYTGCTFTNSVTGKFLNVYNESGATKYTVTCNNCTFVNNASSANKAAINVKATSGSNVLKYDVIINNCTTEGAFPEANWGDALVVLNNVAQVDDRTASGVDNITVTQDGELIYPKTVAKIGDAKYPTLQSAVNAAKEMGGEQTIQLIADISGETVTISEVANFKVTIDGKKDESSNYTIDGQIIIDGLRGNGGSNTNGASVTLQNIAFTDGDYVTTQNYSAIVVPSHYPHHLTITNCTYSGKETDASRDRWFLDTSDAPLYNATISNVTVEHCRFMQGSLGLDVIVENVTAINDVKCGFNIKTEGTVLIKNCQVTTAKYALRDQKDAYVGTITLEDNTFISTSEESDEGAIVNRGGAVGTGHINVVSGTYTGHLKVLNNKEGVLALSGGYFSEEFPQEYIAADLVAAGKACVPATDKEGYYTVGIPHYVAQIGETKYETLTAALAAATDGQTVKLLADIEDPSDEPMSGGTRQFVINKSITLDGDGHTVTTKNRGFGVGMNATSKIDVTFKNVIILNTSDGARCIDTRGNINSLTLDSVTLNTNGAPSGYTQPLTIGGNQADAATISITNSTIQTNDDATAYYAIITFNPVNMTIEGSTIKGWANIYAKAADGSAGSAGSVFTINNSTLVSSNAYSGVSNAFAAFMVEDNNVTVNVTNSDVTIENTGDQIQAIGGAKANLENVNVNLGEGNKVKFVEPGTYAMDFNSAHVIVSGGIFSESVPEENCAEGMIPTDNTDEATKAEYPYAVKEGVFVAQYNGNKYETLQAALDAAEAVDDKNMVIELLADATLDITAWSGTTNALSIGTENTESITINGNSHKLTFNHKNSDWNNVATMNDAQTKLILNDMAITNSGYNNSAWNRHDINFNCAVTLNNVTSEKALAFKNSATLNDVTITDQPGSVYGIWISPRVEGQTVNINGLNLTAERGIKIDDQYVDAPQLTTLNIQNATFNTTAKAAILLKAGAGAVVNAGEGINISNVAKDSENLVWVDENRATEYYKYTTTGASMKPESKEEDYVASLRRGDQIRGYYKTFAAAYNSADYANGDYYQLHQTTTEAVVVNKELTIIKNGYTADNVTAAEGFQREETLKKIVISPTVPEHPYEIADGYYRIKNLGNGNYVNVIGRRSATISTSEADALSLAGTVIKVNAPEGKVETLRSQAVDIPHYAERAMTYVPEFVEMVVQKLGVEGSGEILGTTGVDAIMDKFNKNFDYHLHTEQADDGAVRIYGKTPRMKPVVEFYEENKDKVDAKLPQLEEAINDAIDKVVDKLGRGESLRNSFDLHKVWERMSGNLTEPNDEASKVAFLQEVLMDEAYVWDFGYQAVMIYVEKVENSSYFNEMPAELKKYWNLAKQTHPDFKYYIVQKDGQMDIISEGNIDIINDNDRTKWVLEPAEDFDVDFTIGNMDGEYFATIYTDFGYQLPSGVTAYKVTGIDDNDVAQIEEIGQAVAAQTPVLLKSTTGSGTKTLTIGNYGTSVSGNQLHGADWVINEYDIKNSTVQGLFEIVASVSQSVANEYDYLTSLNSGTVGNKYFFPVTVDGQLSDAYKAKTGNEMNDTPIHYLGVTEDGKVAFVKSWDTIAANAVYMFNETIDPIYLDEPEYPANIAEGYYRIKNDGNNSYVNVRGRRTATVNATEADTKTLPGTVLKVKATNGEVEILRSQAVDLPYYAQRAMSYVPDVVELVVNKLGVDGSGEILGSTGVDAIMQKFNESFDYHLHVEFSSPEAAEGTDTLSNLRIYGKTPSMRPVVEFYQEHKDQVDAKLPMLESEINAAIQKVVEKAGMGSSLLNSFKLETIWTRMGGTLTKPTDDASKLAFLKEVLASEANVWNFAYQTATFYMEKVEGSSVFDKIPAEIRQYWNLAKQVHPNFKYYIVQKDGKMDFISEGNIDIQNNATRTTWSLEPITKFTVNIPETNSKLVGKDKKEYYTTLYTDFGYQLPEGVTALKVTEIKDVQELGLAVTEEIGREVAPQTPVLIKSETAGDITLTIGDNYGSAVTGNLLHGTDWLINEFEINTPSIESLFNIFKEKISASTAEQYEYLLRRNSGTVNNKYFFPISAEDIAAGYKNKTGNEMEETPIRVLDKNGKFLAFYDSWENLPSNAVFIYSEDYKPVFLYLIGDVTRDGLIDVRDVNATINIVLGRDKPEDNYDYEAADLRKEYEKIQVQDVNKMIDLVLKRISLKSLIEEILNETNN